MLAEEFLAPRGITQSELAARIGVPFQRIHLIIHGKRGISPDTALRLARVFDTTPDFWLNGQMAWDLYQAQRDKAAEIRRIKPIPLDAPA